MKLTTREYLFASVTIFVLAFFPMQSFAQPTGGGPGTEPPPVPITGIELLLAAGAGYGAKKAYDVYRKKGKSQ